MSTVWQKLAKAQTEVPELVFDSVNPHFGNQYLSLKGLLAQVLPVLRANDLLLVQSPTNVDGQPALDTKIVNVGAQGGDYIDAGTMLLSATKTDPQAQGSAITYARRYALMSLLSLVADEDDDGNAASGGESSSTDANSTSSGSSGGRGRRQPRRSSSATIPKF